MKIVNQLKKIALFAFSIALMTSCDDTVPEMGGTAQNYNSAYGMVAANTNLTLFNKAIELTNLKATLDTNDDYTYFVPNDVAIDAYLVQKGYVNSLGYPDITLVPVEDLKQLVLSHIVKGAKKRVAKLDGVEADYLVTSELTTMANTLNPELYLLSVNVTNNVLKVAGSSKPALAQDVYGTNGFVNIIENVVSLIPPAPVITGLSQAFASPGDVLIIKGANFVKVKSVKFGSTAAVFTTVSKTEIKATVPANFGSYALVTVETPYGTSNVATLGVKYLMYGDDFEGSPSPLWSWNWGGSEVWQSNDKVSRGTYAIKRVNADAWSGLFIHINPLKAADYQYLKLSVFPTNSTRILFSIAGSSDDSGIAIDVKPGEWNNISIPFSSLHTGILANGEFDSFFMKEYSGERGTVYLDDIGFL